MQLVLLNFVFLILGSLGLPSSIELDVIIICFVACKIRSSFLQHLGDEASL